MADATIARSSQDEALKIAAEQALMNYPGVRVWTDALVLNATNGVIEIKGHVRTQAEKEVTEDVVLKTSGVKDVVTDLFVDTDLEIAVGRALGDDPRTRGSFPGILVGSAFGDLYLKGTVTSAETKKAAGEIANQVPGVKEVYNELEVSGAAKPAPAAAAAKPVAAGAKPAPAAGDKPVAAVKPPASVGGKPVVAVKPPTSVGGKPITPVKPPTSVGGKPITPVKPPTSVGGKPITPVKPPTTVGGRPVTPVAKAAPKPEPEAPASTEPETKSETGDEQAPEKE